MSRLLMIVPSRGRPENVARLMDAFTATASIDTELLICLDDDDPTLADYPAPRGTSRVRVGLRLRMAPTLNLAAVVEANNYDALGFLGDDHLPRTPQWDGTILAELDRLGTGIVYGNDLLQGERLPTAVFMTADIVRTLGWMAPPGLIHLFLDDAWLALGQALDAISYLPDVIIEHCHPLAGKAQSDAGYAEANAPDVWTHDRDVFTRWHDEQLAVDVAKIKASRG